MTGLSIVFGILIGCAEIAMTGLICDAVLTDSLRKAIVPIAVKLVLYGGGIAVAVLTEAVGMLHLGIGFGIGMFCGCVGYIIFKTEIEKKRDKPNGGDGK